MNLFVFIICGIICIKTSVFCALDFIEADFYVLLHYSVKCPTISDWTSHHYHEWKTCQEIDEHCSEVGVASTLILPIAPVHL